MSPFHPVNRRVYVHALVFAALSPILFLGLVDQAGTDDMLQLVLFLAAAGASILSPMLVDTPRESVRRR